MCLECLYSLRLILRELRLIGNKVYVRRSSEAVIWWYCRSDSCLWQNFIYICRAQAYFIILNYLNNRNESFCKCIWVYSTANTQLSYQREKEGLTLCPFSPSVMLEGTIKPAFTSCANGRWDLDGGILNSGHPFPSLSGTGSDQQVTPRCAGLMFRTVQTNHLLKFLFNSFCLVKLSWLANWP